MTSISSVMDNDAWTSRRCTEQNVMFHDGSRQCGDLDVVDRHRRGPGLALPRSLQAWRTGPTGTVLGEDADGMVLVDGVRRQLWATQQHQRREVFGCEVAKINAPVRNVGRVALVAGEHEADSADRRCRGRPVILASPFASSSDEASDRDDGGLACPLLDPDLVQRQLNCGRCGMPHGCELVWSGSLHLRVDRRPAPQGLDVGFELLGHRCRS